MILPSNALLGEITEMPLIGYMIYLEEGKADRENNPARFLLRIEMLWMDLVPQLLIGAGLPEGILFF